MHSLQLDCELSNNEIYFISKFTNTILHFDERLCEVKTKYISTSLLFIIRECFKKKSVFSTSNERYLVATKFLKNSLTYLLFTIVENTTVYQHQYNNYEKRCQLNVKEIIVNLQTVPKKCNVAIYRIGPVLTITFLNMFLIFFNGDR